MARTSWEVFRFGVDDGDIITGQQERIGDFTLCGKGFTGTGRTQNQSVGVIELLSVHHNQIVGQGIEPIVERFPMLEQFLGGERHKDCSAGSGESPLNLDLIEPQRQ